MFIIPVIITNDGSVYASEPAPIDALSTITTPIGCEVYMPEDAQLLAERLAKIE